MLALVATAVSLAAAATSSAKTVWLCKPGQRPDPCTPGLSTTVYSPTLKQLRVIHPKPVPHPAIDCFYVYPTVSDQKTGNANLHVDPEETSIALQQAARYSQYCRVFAPMYRQLTLAGIGVGTPTSKPNPAIALADVRAAFQDYLKHDNHGRGFVLIGDSQGSFALRQLIATDVDRKAAVRRRLVSAILLGGNVLVKKGKKVGGDFQHIPACTSSSELGCVIAFSTFDQPVPTPSLFGRPSSVLGVPAPKGQVVLCTNPAALAGGSALIDPIFPSQPFDPTSMLAVAIALLGLNQPTPPTVWSSEPGAYRAQCSSANNANVLEITAVGGAATPKPSPTPDWGLHLLDANIELGNLVTIVKSEAAAFLKHGH
jgi:Protein of unknown function (DUF3089)